jgi:hypothetical protein
VFIGHETAGAIGQPAGEPYLFHPVLQLFTDEVQQSFILLRCLFLFSLFIFFLFFKRCIEIF